MTFSNSLDLERDIVLISYSCSPAQYREYIYSVKQGSRRLSSFQDTGARSLLCSSFCRKQKFEVDLKSLSKGVEAFLIPERFCPSSASNTRLLSFIFLNNTRVLPSQSPWKALFQEVVVPFTDPHLNPISGPFTEYGNDFPLEDLKGKIWPKIFPNKAAKTMSSPPPS